jgi:hypothetical protein
LLQKKISKSLVYDRTSGGPNKEDIFSLLVPHFSPFPAKKSQNRHPREEKNSERKERLKFEFWFQCDITCKRLWVNTETRDSPPSLAPAKLSSHTNKKLGKKNKKTHQKIQEKKKEHTQNKKIPSAFLSTSSSSSSSSPSRSELHAIHVELVKSRKVQPECTRERARCAAKERGDSGAYLYHDGDRCERGVGHVGIIKPTGNGHVVVTRRPMYVKTLIVIHFNCTVPKSENKIYYSLLLIS